MIPERWETDEVSASVISAYGLEEFLVCDRGREIQAEPSELPKLKKQIKNPKSSKWPLFTRQRSEEKRMTQREPQRSAEGPS